MKRPNLRLALLYVAAIFFAVTMLTSCSESELITIQYFDGSLIVFKVDSRMLDSHSLPPRFYRNVESIRKTKTGQRVYYTPTNDGIRSAPRRVTQY